MSFSSSSRLMIWARVETSSADRLVADDDPWVEAQRTGNANALALAAGFVRVAIGLFGAQAHATQHRHDAVLDLAFAVTPRTRKGSSIINVDARRLREKAAE